jgi:hypothetical protein
MAVLPRPLLVHKKSNNRPPASPIRLYPRLSYRNETGLRNNRLRLQMLSHFQVISPHHLPQLISDHREKQTAAVLRQIISC